MSILITGATGFVGKRLLIELEKSGYTKDKLLLLSSKLVEGYSCIQSKDYSFTREDFKDAQIDMVLHMGAVTPKGKEKQGMLDYVKNVTFTLQLLEQLPNIPQKIIFGSSVSVYDMTKQPVNEESILTSTDAYGLTKLVCERMMEEWCDTHGVCLQVLRFGPIYGPGEETYNKISGAFLKKAMNNEEIHIFSDGSDLRSMVYVDDVCNQIVRATQLEEYVGPINITEHQAITIKELAKLAVEVSGSDSNIILDNKGKLRSEEYDNSKMRTMLGQLAVNYREGMNELYQYLKKR